MKKILLVTFLLFLLHGTAKGQISRGQWSYGPVITTTNNFYGNIAENLLWSGIAAGELYDEWHFLRGIIPRFRAKFDILKDIDTPVGDGKVRWWDFGLRNYTIGYHLGYLPSVSSVGFEIQVDYEKQNWRVKFPDQESFKNYEKRMVVPTVLLKGRFGDFTMNDFNIIVEAGAKYNHVLKAKGDYTDVKSLNNGFTGVLGIGLLNTGLHGAIQLRYEHDFYDYFNKDFSPDGFTKPYEGVSSKHGSLNLHVTLFGF